jgi:hypothetical protein
MRLISVTGLLALAYVFARYVAPVMVDSDDKRLIKAFSIIAPTMVLIIGGLAVFGLCLITARDPALVDRERPLSPRRVMRGLIIALVILLAMYEPAKMWMPGARPGLLVIAGGLSIACILSAFRYAMSLARQIPDQNLLTQTRGVMWGMILHTACSARWQCWR